MGLAHLTWLKTHGVPPSGQKGNMKNVANEGSADQGTKFKVLSQAASVSHTLHAFKMVATSF